MCLVMNVQGLPRQATDSNGRLTISETKVADSGEYVCSAVNVPGVRSASARLSVEPVCKLLVLFCIVFGIQISTVNGYLTIYAHIPSFFRIPINCA